MNKKQSAKERLIKTISELSERHCEILERFILEYGKLQKEKEQINGGI